MLDTQLVERCRAGDTDALAELFLRYNDRVFRLAYLVTHSRQDAQDITQEAFIHVIKALRAFDPARGTFETWLYAIAVNLARDHLRRQKRILSSWHLLEESIIRSGGRDEPEQVSLENEWQRAIWQAVNELEEKQRLVVILRYYLDLSCAEIAQVLRCPEGTVYSRLHYARLALEKKLGEFQGHLAWSYV